MPTAEAQPSNSLRWLIIAVAVVVAGSLIGWALYRGLSTPKVIGVKDIRTSVVNLGKTVRVVNPVDVGLTSLRVDKVIRGEAATAIVGQVDAATHERLAVQLTVCADSRFSPNGTVAMHVETSHGDLIFPDPSTAATSLLNAAFSHPSCEHRILGFTVARTAKLSRFTYLQFPYLRANWRLSAPSNGSRS